jgi:site-specific recombinase XerD
MASQVDMVAPNDIAELEAEFRVMLQATNRSPATITAYMAGLTALRRYLAEHGMPTAVDAVAREHIEAAYAGWIEGGYAPASVKNRHDGIRQFFVWCVEEGEVPEATNPMRHVKPPRVPENPPPVLRTEEVRALLDACDGKTFEDRRDAALVMVLFDTGLRLAECAGITTDDIDLADLREVRVLGKGRKERTVPIGSNAARALARYARMRRQHRGASSPSFWLGSRGAMTPSGIRQVLEKRGIEAGIGPVSPHRLRHTFAHQWLRPTLRGGRATTYPPRRSRTRPRSWQHVGHRYRPVVTASQFNSAAQRSRGNSGSSALQLLHVKTSPVLLPITRMTTPLMPSSAGRAN